MRDLSLNAGLTWAETKYRKDLVGTDNGAPLSPALRMLPGDNISNAPKSSRPAPLPGPRRSAARADRPVLSRYAVQRPLQHGFRPVPAKGAENYAIVNGRIGIHGPDDRWAVELWAQNLLDKDYAQVAFNSPFQAGGSSTPPFAPTFTFAPSSTRNSRADGSSSRCSWRSRGRSVRRSVPAGPGRARSKRLRRLRRHRLRRRQRKPVPTAR